MWLLLSEGTLQVAFPLSTFRAETHVEIDPASSLP